MSRARRAAQTAKRKQAAYDLDVRWAFRNDRLPRYAEAVAICPCGRRSWLMPGATDEERQDFDRSVEDHDAYSEAAS